MENNSYGINFKSEIKRYEELCKCKSEKYKNYLEWREGMLSLISSFDVKTLENFKHYCLYNEEACIHEMNIFLPIAISFISLLISFDVASESTSFFKGVVSVIIASIISSALITRAYSSFIFSKNFYRDVAEIVKEKIESLPEEERLLIKINSDNSQKLLSSNAK